MKKILTAESAPDGKPLFNSAAEIGERIADISSHYKNPRAAAKMVGFVFRSKRTCPPPLRDAILSISRRRLSKQPKDLQDVWILRIGKAIDAADEAVGSSSEDVDRSQNPKKRTSIGELVTEIPRAKVTGNVVGSPKGGVGRTLFLVHAALIQATGCDWAGLESSFPLLLDFDFNAPGLQTYPLSQAGEWCGETWTYRTLDDATLPQAGLTLRLDKHQVGTVFLFLRLCEEPVFEECERLLAKNDGEEFGFESAIEKLAKFLREQSTKPSAPTNPLRHLVAVGAEAGDDPRFAFYPAGSPANPQYRNAVRELRWEERLASGMGLVLIEALLLATKQISEDEQGDSSQTEVSLLNGTLGEIWIDQSPGQSITTFAHKHLSQRTVLVSSFTLQSTEGLLAWLGEMRGIERSNTWVNLSFYRGRHLPLSDDYLKEDAFVYSLIDHAAEKATFESIDDERAELMKKLQKECSIGMNRIGISDFEPDLVNSNSLRGPGTEYFQSVVRMLISMDAEAETRRKGYLSEEHVHLRVLGEYVGDTKGEPDDSDSRPAGVFKAFVEWLVSRMPNASVTGLAMSHRELAKLANGDSFEVYEEEGPSQLRPGEFVLLRAEDETGEVPTWNHCVQSYTLKDFDLVSLPSYTVDDNPDMLRRFSIADLPELNIETADHIGAVNARYLKANIRAWDEDCSTNDKESIVGVPIFSHYPLIVMKDKFLREREVFRKAFAERSDRDFIGFNSFADVRNAALVGSRHQASSLIMGTESVQRVYEWMLVIGCLGCRPFDQTPTDEKEPFYACLANDEMVFEATKRYALLSQLAPKKQDYSWNECMSDINLGNAGFMFLWPDAVFGKYKNLEEFTFSAIPARYQLRETWILAIPNRETNNEIEQLKWQMLIDFMTPESQKEFSKLGGIPVHSKVADDPDVWRRNPFALFLGLIRRARHDQNTISIPRNATGAQLITLGKILAGFVNEFSKKISKENNKLDFMEALRLAQTSKLPQLAELETWWKKQLKKLN